MRFGYRNPDHGLAALGVAFSASVPITSAMVADPAQGQGGFMQLGAAAEGPPSTVGIAVGSSAHATNVHVAMWLLAGGAFIAAWHFSGFRMAFDVGMGR